MSDGNPVTARLEVLLTQEEYAALLATRQRYEAALRRIADYDGPEQVTLIKFRVCQQLAREALAATQEGTPA
jgi:hypothetical protein